MLRPITRLDEFFDRLSEQPVLAAVGTSGLSGLLIIISYFLNLDHVAFRGILKNGVHIADFGANLPNGLSKDVGFLYALNWSAFGVIVLPIIVYASLQIRKSVPALLHALADRRMLRTANFEPVCATAAIDGWLRMRSTLRYVYAGIFVLMALLIGVDWWKVVAQPTLYPDVLRAVKMDHPQYEFDWSVCSVIDGCTLNRWVNLAFSLIVYIFMAFFGTSLGFIAMIGGAVSIFYASGLMPGRDSTWRLAAVPDDPEDERLGFEVFAPIFSWLVGAALAISSGIYLMIVQNAYLRQASDYNDKNVLAFVFKDITSAPTVENNQTGLWESILAWATKMVSFVSNTNIEFGLLAYMMVVSICVMTSTLVLRLVARDARKFSSVHVGRLKAELDNVAGLKAELTVSEDEIRRRLRSMQFWPLRWISLDILLGILFLFSFAIFSYRVIVLILAFLAIRYLAKLFNM